MAFPTVEMATEHLTSLGLRSSTGDPLVFDSVQIGPDDSRLDLDHALRTKFVGDKLREFLFLHGHRDPYGPFCDVVFVFEADLGVPVGTLSW